VVKEMTMPPPTTTWICDACGEPIEEVRYGWVEWVDFPREFGVPRRSRDIRIVHHVSVRPGERRCQFDHRVEGAKDGGGICDGALADFQGPDGLMRLLEMISEQQFPTKDVLEMIKRIHTPGYEHARLHFKAAVAKGVIDTDVPDGYWWQDDLQRVLDFAAGR
jgi:hypothetical protein